MTFVKPGSSGNTYLRQYLIETVQQALATAWTPGATVAVLLDGQPVVVSGVGYRDSERLTVLDAHAQFYIYSVTKTLLATVILQLMEHGRVALDAPAQMYLTELSLDTSVTIRQLLNHTSGLPDYGALAAYREALQADPTHPWTDDEFLTHTLSQGFVFAPGHGWRYSNIGFLLLRRLIENVMRTSLHTALHRQIFAPLGLQHTFVADTLDDAGRLTPGYSSFFRSDNELQDVRGLYHPGWVAHGVVVATAPELAQIIDALFTDRLLTVRSRAAMLEPVLVPHQHPLFQQPAYGLGVMIDPQSSYGIIAGHGGGGPGYSAGALHIPNVHGHRITSIVLGNRDQDDLGLRTAFALATILGNMLGT